MATRTRWLGLGLTVIMMTVVAAGCGRAQDKLDEAHRSASARATTTSVKATAPQRNSANESAGWSSSDAPIGGRDIDMGSSSAPYPPDKVSSQGAQDRFAGGTRIYDRSGVTCA